MDIEKERLLLRAAITSLDRAIQDLVFLKDTEKIRTNLRCVIDQLAEKL